MVEGDRPVDARRNRSWRKAPPSRRLLGLMAGIPAIIVGGAVWAADKPVHTPPPSRTAFEHLRAAAKPRFRKGHTLLPLTRWGWTMPFETRVELSGNWGYALEFGGYATPGYVALLDKPDSIPAKLAALTASNPKRYPLCVLTHRPLSDGKFRAQLPEETWCHDAEGKRFKAPQWKTWSPEAPDEVFKKTAELTVATLKKIQKKAPIAIILNGGEYGLSVYGHSGAVWSKDPKVLKAKGNKAWYEYISERKAHQEMFITKAVRAQCPKRKLYLWYHFGGMPTWSPWQWSIDYKPMRKVSDLPDQSLYYKHYNSGWAANDDLLTHALDSVAQCMAYGDRFAYNWVCGGWKKGKFSDSERYMGFLKCLYTTGMLGAVAGYFSYPKPGFAEKLGPEIPSWLWQMMHLARAQALFSHLEEFLRDGELLPGPEKHRRAKKLPAYEFPTGHRHTRVLARKRRKRQAWLIAAWAADGIERQVSVTIPELGTVEVLARPCGSVYRATLVQEVDYEPPVPKLILVDQKGMLPSAGL